MQVDRDRCLLLTVRPTGVCVCDFVRVFVFLFVHACVYVQFTHTMLFLRGIACRIFSSQPRMLQSNAWMQLPWATSQFHRSLRYVCVYLSICMSVHIYVLFLTFVLFCPRYIPLPHDIAAIIPINTHRPTFLSG